MDLSSPLRLRRGYQAVRRDAESLQVGLDAPTRAVLADVPEVRALLEDLVGGVEQAPRTPAAGRAFEALHEAGLLEPVRSPRPGAVRVQAPESLRIVLAPLLKAAELCASPDAELTLVAEEAPVQRSRLDPLVRAGHPHLVVAGSPQEWTVGPFVVAGTTACIRCVDAHHAHRDPRRPIVLDQLARLGRTPATTLDPLARLTALSLAVADLREFLAGRTPATWSATYRVGAGAPQRQEWSRHPHCGCAWDLVTAIS